MIRTIYYLIIVLICFPLNSVVAAQSKSLYLLGGEVGGNYSKSSEGSVNADIGVGVKIDEELDYRIGAISQSSLSLNITPQYFIFSK